MDPDSLSNAVLLALLLLALGGTATIQNALESLSRARYQRLLDQGKRVRIIEGYFENTGHYLTTVEVARTLAATAAVAAGAILLNRLTTAESTLVGGVILLVLILVAGYVVPRAIAIHEPETTAHALRWPLALIVFGCGPLVSLLTITTAALSRLFGHPNVPEGPVLTTEELRVNLAAAEEGGLIRENERDMIDGIFDLEDTTVWQIMVPRIDMVAIPRDATIAEAVDLIVGRGYSRLPVYGSSVDAMLGVLHAKDLLPLLRAGRLDASVGEFVRPIYLVPESKRVDELLREMQQRKVQMAIVIDEYGGTAGLVTVEDLLEEIVGEIRDEFDREEDKITETADGEAVFDATVSIDDVNDTLGTSLSSESVDTVGGLVSERLGRIARVGDRVEAGGATLAVLSTKGRRIHKVRITRTQPQTGDAEGTE